MKDYTKDITSYIDKLTTTLKRVDVAELNAFINTLETARAERKNIFIMGNGGSASTASHFVCDFSCALLANYPDITSIEGRTKHSFLRQRT